MSAAVSTRGAILWVRSNDGEQRKTLPGLDLEGFRKVPARGGRDRPEMTRQRALARCGSMRLQIFG